MSGRECIERMFCAAVAGIMALDGDDVQHEEMDHLAYKILEWAGESVERQARRSPYLMALPGAESG